MILDAIDKIMLGSIESEKIYLGSNIVYESETVDPNLVYKMPSPFIGGTTTPYESDWIPDNAADWRLEMYLAMHDSYTLPDNYAPQEFGVTDSSATNDRLAIGIIAINGDACAWARCGSQFWNSTGNVFAPDSSHKLELFWYGSQGRYVFKVDDVTLEDATGTDLAGFDVPLLIGGRNNEGGTDDRLVEIYDTTSFKIFNIP